MVLLSLQNCLDDKWSGTASGEDAQAGGTANVSRFAETTFDADIRGTTVFDLCSKSVAVTG
jgi:hypothetical protein